MLVDEDQRTTAKSTRTLMQTEAENQDGVIGSDRQPPGRSREVMDRTGPKTANAADVCQ